MLRVVLIDDERLARQRLRQLLAREPKVEIVGEAASAAEGEAVIREMRPDAVFLDVRMPGPDGFALIRAVHPKPKVVVVTAYAKHAAEAFDIQAVDFLLKPVRPERLGEAVRRLREKSDEPTNVPLTTADRYCFRTPEKTVVVPVTSVRALQAEGDFTRVFIESEKPLFICHPLGYYERSLPNPPFERIDRSLLLHTGKIHRLEPEGDGARIWMEGVSDPFVIGRTARRRLSKILAK